MASYAVKQSSTAYPLDFLMIDSADHVTGKTGLSPTVTISKSGAAFASPAGAVSEIGNGWYKVAGNATDSGTLGPLVLHASSAGADPTDTLYEVVAVDPQSANYGLTNLDAAVSTRSTYAGGAVASVTGNVGGNVVGSVASVTAGVTVTTNNDKTGYALTVTPPTAAQIDTQLSGVHGAGTWGGSFSLGANAPADWINASSVKADAVTKIQAGLSTYAGGDTPGTTTLLGQVGTIGTNVITIGSNVMTNLDAKVSSRSTYAGGPVASVTAPVTVGSITDKTGYKLASDGFDSIQVEAGINARQALSPILAAAAGVVSGAGTSQVRIQAGHDPATNRIDATVDEPGNRLSVTLNLPA